MPAGLKSGLGADLARIFRQGTAPGGDRALLESFLAEGDEAAFEALVARHGPMVRGVCRRLLASPHDADDAFQATFLVLVRKAGRLRDADRLGPWLHGVALRVATKARMLEARRRRRQGTGGDEPPAREGPDADLIDVRPILDAELGRLPGRLRDVLVLCLLEGATADEASRRLGCPVGTVKSRLARGREALRSRLVGRGLAPALAVAAASSTLASPVSASLTRATLDAVAGPPAGLAPGIAELTRGVAPAMISKSAAMTALALGGLALAGLGLASWPEPAAQAQAQQPGAPEARPAAGKPDLRRQSMDHVKQIMLAVHNFAAATPEFRFPGAAIHGPDGRPTLSWRVALLPYLEEKALYDEFRQDEPWDSPHNKALIPRMPAVFRTPDFPAPDGETRFRGFSGPGTLLEAGPGIQLAAITDGTSSTLMIAEARDPTLWTKPGELAFGEGAELPAIGEPGKGEALIGLADGAARYIPTGDPALIRALITRNGGEVIRWKGRFEPPTVIIPPVPALPAAPATPGPPAAGSVEQRLQRVEEKLDRLIRRLDAQAAGAKP